MSVQLWKEESHMKLNKEPLFVGVETVQFDFGVSRAKAYDIIRNLNDELRKQHPKAIIVAGKVNRFFYEEACLMDGRVS